ncbi:aminotransferase class III-fold pyridoxal phosphate-dependent enzyme [Dongia deserti]|uniref:aminotransferase class III-fold pyridoxal phosphate-dependent enzyme n=1 Tax=Dongia deserti TaxID=2268030 RepID=UPI000E65DCBD|nr:aminotransferase class III-fold pyridoxal phosphate-dependent enzyme [Dongia deserti]
MSVLTTLPPAFTPDEVAGIARELYGLTGSLTPLDSERDQNFRLSEADGTNWVLKVANEAEDSQALAFQAALLRHVQAVDPALPLPHLRPTLAGEDLGKTRQRGGAEHFVRLVSWLPGQLFSSCRKTVDLHDSLGEILGRLDRALQGFGHAGGHRLFDWDIKQAGRSRARLEFINDPAQRAILEHFLGRFENEVASSLARLRAQVIHGDANDNNLLVDGPIGQEITGLIDFGDAIHSATIGELAVACAYAILGEAAPIDVAGRIAAAYHRVYPLQSEELDLLFDLIAMRLVTSVTISASRRERVKDNAYLSVSEAPAWAMLERLRAMDSALATGILRHACGFEAAPGARAVVQWIANNPARLRPVLDKAPALLSKAKVPFGDPSHPIAKASAARQPDEAERLWREIAEKDGIELGIGPWCEERPVYSSDSFRSVFAPDQRRSLHLGLDLFAPAGSNVRTPLDGTVVDLFETDLPLDYGHAVLLRHDADGLIFHSLWGHLSAQTVHDRQLGERLKAGDVIGQLGAPRENGNWQPHVHIQLITYEPARAADIIGAGEGGYRAVWEELFPDPVHFAGLSTETLRADGKPKEVLLKARKSKLIRNLSISYRRPLKIVRGEGVWLIDETGRAYLDCYNNVAQLGHSNPEIIETMARQAAILNTNTRYLHDNVIAYAEALTATLPAKLKVAAFCCTGSEANDLALRMARTHARAKDVITLDWAYHGHTHALIDISPYKYKRKGGRGRPGTTWEAPLPDAYRAPEDWPKAEIGRRYAQPVAEIASTLAKEGRGIAAFIAESLPSSAGQIVLPDGYLKAAHEAARAAGAVVIADEVQIGFGRVGSHLWAFETQDATPDIITMGKPIGNGHPMSALVTTEEIAESFANGMEYFNTFGGNPVSCAVGLKVLEIIARDGLLRNASAIGGDLLTRMRALMEKYAVIGDVRGLGLMLGIDLVTDRRSKEPATERAGRVVERCRELGVLMGTDGPFDNVIKLRPALIFNKANADHLMQVLEQAFADTEE